VYRTHLRLCFECACVPRSKFATPIAFPKCAHAWSVSASRTPPARSMMAYNKLPFVSCAYASRYAIPSGGAPSDAASSRVVPYERTSGWS